MEPEIERAPSVLTTEEVEVFRRDGWVRVKQAFSPELALAMRDEIWTELKQDHGIDREDRSTWTQPRRSPHRAKELPLNAELASERFQGVISDLLGDDDWTRPRTWGGFGVNFPKLPGTPMDVPDDTWHWDGHPASKGFLVFSYYSAVRPGGGGTLILPGSPRLIAAFYASLSAEDRARAHKVHRKLFFRWHSYLEALTGQSTEPVEDRVAFFMQRTTDVHGVPCRVLELTGEPGDAIYCNLGMVHAVVPNRLEEPRFMRVKFLFLDEARGSLAVGRRPSG